MNRRMFAFALAGAVLLLGPTLVLAHHGAATFDTEGEITLQGSVTEWVWSNPHSILRLDVKAEDGTVKHWSVATANIADLSKRGWSRRLFAAGDMVTVIVQPAKSGEPVGMIRTVTLADGRKFQ